MKVDVYYSKEKVNLSASDEFMELVINKEEFIKAAVKQTDEDGNTFYELKTDAAILIIGESFLES